MNAMEPHIIQSTHKINWAFQLKFPLNQEGPNYNGRNSLASLGNSPRLLVFGRLVKDFVFQSPYYNAI